MANNFNGIAAQAVIYGNNPAAILTGITERRAWDEAAQKRKDAIESLALDVVSPATRFNKITVTVPVAGCQFSLADSDIEAIAQNGGIFPFVRFEGLTVKLWTSRESSSVQISATATKALLCNELGVSKK